MPYLGQRPSKGDENNFKILDNISSYTLTFDGSDSAVVSAADDTITSLSHRFVQGQRVTYNKGGGTVIAGLSDGVYYIIKEDHNTIKLATSASNATNGIAVNITGVGGGSSHTLNVAFDGVNTKFKATHTNGQKAKITRSAQLVISMNGVIQQPHDTATPSTGFGFDLDGTIVFSQAPVSTDVYWAHVLTNNNVTFDISDNDVDNFTGNGNTVSFNLSKTPPDNRNVLVTIEGVVQHPNDPDGTVRAYNVVENVLTFTTAPAAGAEIQVRHIGFAGSTSGGGGSGVTNFYGRTGSVTLINTDNIVANNAEFAGNLTVQGTMTTLDTKVTEVDQLEVAANNTTVGVAITQSGSGDILNLYDGSSEVFTVTDGGITKLTKGLQILPATNNLYSIDGTLSYYGTTNGVYLNGAGASGWLRLQASGVTNDRTAINLYGQNMGGFGDQIHIKTASGERIKIGSDGKIGINTTNTTNLVTVFALAANTVIARFKAVNGNSNFDIATDASSHGQAKVKNNIGATKVQLNSNGDSYFTGGDVGINSTSPREKLDVIGNANIIVDNNKGIKLGYRGENKTAYIGLDANDAANAGSQSWANSAYIGFYSDGSSERSIKYRANVGSHIFQGTNGTEFARITSTGKIGIGITNPTEKFEVKNGNIAIVGGLGYKIDTHPLLTTASFTDISGGSYAARLGSTGTSTIRSTQIYGGGNHIATFDGVNYRLGIYETTPEAGLHITGGLPSIRLENSGTSASANDIFGQIDFKHNDSSDAGVTAAIKCVAEDANGNSFLAFYNGDGGNADERLRIGSNGNITVNKGNAIANATIILSKGATGYAKLEFDEVNTQRAYIELDASESLVHYGAANVEQIFYAGGGKRMTIGTGGDIAIGSHTPDGQLSIRAANASFPRLVISNEDNDENINLSTYHDSNGIYAFLGANSKLDSSGNITRDTSGHRSSGIFLDARNNGYLTFYTGEASGNPEERFRITSDGRVGINTTLTAMDGVTGNLNIANTNYNNHTVINLSRNTASHRAQIRFQNTNGNVGSIDTFGSDLIVSSGNDLKFYTNSTEKVTISSTGKLTINNHGTNNLRSLSVLAPQTQIQFGTANDVGGFLMSSNNGQFGLSGGGYWNGSNWIAKHTASSQIRTDGDGDISFCTNTSLTSGNTFVPDEKVTIKSNGRVGINETNPTSMFEVHTDFGLADNTYNVRTSYRSGNNASGYTASGLHITSSAANNNGEKHTAFLGFSNRDPALNGSHGSNAFIAMSTPDSPGSYGTGQLDFYIRGGAPYAFPNDPQAASGYWMESLFRIESNGRVKVPGELRVDRIVPDGGLPSGSFGGIIQIRWSANVDNANYSSTSDVAMQTVNITPQRTSSRMLIHVCYPSVRSYTTGNTRNRLNQHITRNGSEIYSLPEMPQWRGANFAGSGVEINKNIAFTHIDHPNTTNQVTYTATWQSADGHVWNTASAQMVMIVAELTG